MKKFKVGIQLYGVKTAMAEDVEATLTAIRDMGYEYVEFAGYFGKSAEELRALIDKLGLKCISVHQNLDFYNEDPDAAAEFIKTLGAKYSVIPWYKKESLAGTPDWDATVERFMKIGNVLKAHGMKMGYHNHDFEFETYEGKYLHDYIFEAIPAELLDPEFDTCWVHYAGLNPADKIREFKGRVEIVHLKDFACKRLAGGPTYDLIDEKGNPIKTTREDNEFEFRPLGMGRQNFAEILAACEECGTEVVIVEQDKVYGGMTELEAAKISRDYLKNTFGI